MNWFISSVALMLLLVLPGTGCREVSQIESISIDFPIGETRLLVRSNGEAFLFYGALPQSKIIKKRTFNLEELYKQLLPRLHDNAPREEWPNPQSKAGMVMFHLKDKSEKVYLIFDEESFSDALFSKARENIVGQDL